MRAALVTVLTHHSSQMQVRRRKRHTNLLLRLSTGASVRRFADLHLQFPATRTPKSTIGLLGPFQ